ncbi:NAD(P)-binding protein [Auriscalpium vulgare]|uniref:NAD(P)-binding protein n=1 Tax=Auriscalpium vulgare TaxID=40419 RepID=A0ACB8RA82_9AGAM|nr:NAD(P)-binding protein [Auriscalpium vulgare]
MYPFILVTPATRGLSLALTRHYLSTTALPVYATHRSSDPDGVFRTIVEPLSDKSAASRLHLLPLDLASEDSIAAAAQHLSASLSKERNPYLHTGFFTGGMLHPERQPADLDAQTLQETFQINVISHLLLIKHFARFLPSARTGTVDPLAKWVHVTARVGSISDNKKGGWYSYRASKAALNQVVKTFDLQLQMQKKEAVCVGVHPGTVKTKLSESFWSTVKEGQLFEPAYAAERLAKVVEELGTESRGRTWDWEGKEVVP